MDLGLRGKVAIVLAASKGLGRASAAALAAEGTNLVIGARNQATLNQAVEDLRQSSNGRVLVIGVPTDVTREEDLERIVDTTVSEFGRIDILVNNAGGPPRGKFPDFNDAQWLAAYELTFLSVVRMVRLVLPHMRKTGSGRIITIVSTSVKQPIDNLVLSNSIRPGVIGLTKSLSIDLAPDNITVNNICPGSLLTDRFFDTPAKRAIAESGLSEEELLKEFAQGSGIPMGRLGKPAELGALVAFLSSEQASYITGTTIQVDGGLTRTLL
jgi:3-oxoacyl-[acyl-carrier protein] reductase